MNQEASKETTADISTRLAHDRTDAAMTRTRMAADRTLMAWIRTSLSMISFGFTILKFFEYLSEAQGPLGHFHGQRARHLGLVLISIGTLILIPAIFQNYRLMKRLSAQDRGSAWSLSLVVAIVIGSFGVFAFVSSIFKWMF
jgi:inner membrane protein YidH